MSFRVDRHGMRDLARRHGRGDARMILATMRLVLYCGEETV